MARTLLSMSKNVASDAGYAGQFSSVSAATGDAARIVRFVSEACQYIEGLWADWRFLWGGMLDGVTSINSAVIVPPPGLYRWDRDRLYIEDRAICPMLFNDFVPWSGDSDGGYPSRLVIMPDSSIRIYPAPDDAYRYSFSWYKEPAVLSQDTDEPNIPDRFRKIIEARALWLYAMYDDAQELAAKADAEYQAWYLLLDADQRPGGFANNQSQGNHITIFAE